MAAARELAELQNVAGKTPRSLLGAVLRTLEAGEQPLRGAFIYPAWQFTSSWVLPGLEEVLAA